MQTFGLIFAGVLLGVILTALLLSAALLYYASLRLRQSLARAQASLQSTLARNTEEVARLRGDISISLSKLDADRLQHASLAIQRNARTLAGAVATLSKLVYAQPDPHSPDYTRGMDPNRMVDLPEEMVQPGENEDWPEGFPSVYTGAPPPSNPNAGVWTPNQLADFMEAQRQAQTHPDLSDQPNQPSTPKPLQDIDDTLAELVRDESGGIEDALV